MWKSGEIERRSLYAAPPEYASAGNERIGLCTFLFQGFDI
jgi:hypothetical protein